MQYSSQRPQPNQFGAYGQNMTQNIGTTQTEQMMRSGMGGLSQVMQADRNKSYYGPRQPQYQGGMGGVPQYGGSYGMPQYGQTTGNYGGYQQSSQFGSFGPGTNQNIGTTPTEQMMLSGMGGLSQVMQADRNLGSYGPSQPQYQWGTGGGQQFGGNFGMQQSGLGNYGMQSQQFGGPGWGVNQNIGTTPTEQMMRSGMGGLPQVMQADHNTGYYGPRQPQYQWGTGGGQQYSSNIGMQPGSFGNYGVQPSQGNTSTPGMSQNIGTTPTEQTMQSGGMGGLSQVMQADRNTGYYGPSQPQQQFGTGTSPYSGQQGGDC
jgi:hypothetical protein